MRTHALSHARLHAAAHAVPQQQAPPPAAASPPRVRAKAPSPGSPHGHVLVDGRVRQEDEPKTDMRGLSPQQLADRILASLLNSQGPILLCLPGTNGAAYQTTMLRAARAVVAQHGGPMAVASIPYHNGPLDVVPRYFKIGTGPERSVLALVLKGLRERAPGRPVLLVGESQGSWVIAHDLQDPVVAAGVTRVVLFSKPGFQKLPSGIGAALRGAAGLPGQPGLIEFRHVDDVVPSLFSRLGGDVAGSYVKAFGNLFRTGRFEYPPHHYEVHGGEAARYLLEGIVPERLVHHSTEHPQW